MWAKLRQLKLGEFAVAEPKWSLLTVRKIGNEWIGHRAALKEQL